MAEQVDNSNRIILPVKSQKRSKRGSIALILAILIAVLFIILTVSQYLLPGQIPPIISANRTETQNEWVFTITSTSGYSILKTDIQIGTKNATGVYLIMWWMLLDASGTQGFNYTAFFNGGNIKIGDVFRFNKAIYAHGSIITLTSPSASGGYYCQWII
jgi:hypothetical protein